MIDLYVWAFFCGLLVGVAVGLLMPLVVIELINRTDKEAV